MTQILPVYEQTKQAMQFDPEGMALVFGPPQNWDLHEDHPVDVMTRIKEMATELGWTQEQLEQEWAWMSWLSTQERSTGDADESAQQDAAPPGHTGPASGGGAAQAPAEHVGEAGTDGQSGGDQGGEAEPVPGRGDPQAHPGGQHEGDS